MLTDFNNICTQYIEKMQYNDYWRDYLTLHTAATLPWEN